MPGPGGGDGRRAGTSESWADAVAFVEAWRRAEPRLRHNVARFPVQPHDVDDVLSEAFLRLFRARTRLPTNRTFLALADGVARRVVLDWMRRDAKRAASLRRRGLTMVPLSESELDSTGQPDPAAAAAEESMLLQMAIKAKLPELSRQERRAVLLLWRGGPFANAELVAIHRGRKRLDQLFRGLLGSFSSVAAWGRERVSGLRARLKDPHPFLPILAGAASAVGLASLAVSSAAPARLPLDAPARPEPPARAGAGPAASSPPQAVSRSSHPAPVPARTNGSEVPPTGPTSARPLGNAAAVTARAAARLPTAGNSDVASIGIAREVPAAGGNTLVTATVKCNSEVRRTLCDTWAGLATDS